MTPEQQVTAINEAAEKEGWKIFDCSCTDNGRWQVQKMDDGHLTSDEDAWRLVLGGFEEHHVATRAFIREYNPLEWEAITKVKP